MHPTPTLVDLESTRLPYCTMTMVEDESSRTISSLLNTDALDLNLIHRIDIILAIIF